MGPPARLPLSLARCCLVLLLALWQLQGLAQPAQPVEHQRDHISARAWLDDPTNSLGPQQVRDMAWTPYAGPLRRGFTASTTWMRLRIEPLAVGGLSGPDRQPRLVLRIQPGHLDEIALFDPRNPDLPPQLAGDRHDWRLGEYRSFNQNLVIDAPRAPLDVLLRLRTNSHHGIDVEALRWVDAEALDRQQQMMMGVVITLLLVVLAWAVSRWSASRERVIGAFTIHQMVSILFALCLLGFFRVYLSDWLPAWALDRITSVMFPITSATVLWFHWHFLREFKPPALGMRALQWLAAVFLLSIPMMAGGLMRQALQLNAVVVTTYPALLLLLGLLTAKPAPNAPRNLTRWHLGAIYSTMLLVLWLAALPALGWLPGSPWAMYSAIAYGLVSAAMMFAALRYRGINAERARRKAINDLALAELRVEQERKRHAEQDQFMTMLSHELTNALATAHLAIGSLAPESAMRGRGYRAIESMRDIIRRCSQSGEFEASDAALQIEAVNVRALLQELFDQMPTQAEVVLNAGADMPACPTDRKLLGVILGNLLDNALKYGAPAGAIKVAASPQRRGGLGGLQLSVSNLPGPAGKPDATRVFTKYWRGPASTRCAGSGLGLYLSALLAKRLGGELRYQPEDANVRFELWLPF